MTALVTTLGRLLFIARRKTPPPDPKRILVVKPGAIGDVLMTTPLLRALRRQYPKSRVTYLVGGWSAPVLEHNPNVDRLWVVPDEIFFGPLNLLAILRLLGRLRAEQFDLAVIPDRRWTAGVFAWLAGCRFRVGSDRRGEAFASNLRVPYGPVRHEIEYNLDLLRALAPAAPTETSLELVLTRAERRAASSWASEHAVGRPRIGLLPGGAQNPGLATYVKRWPMPHWISLARTVRAQFPRASVVLFGGAGDAEANTTVSSAVPGLVEATGLTLRASAALLGEMDAFVSIDSGPMHLAAAVGTPVVALFGPVHPGRVAPQGAGHRVLWRPDLPGALAYEEGRFPHTIEPLPCMVGLAPETVFVALRQVLATRQRQ